MARHIENGETCDLDRSLVFYSIMLQVNGFRYIRKVVEYKNEERALNAMRIARKAGRLVMLARDYGYKPGGE